MNNRPRCLPITASFLLFSSLATGAFGQPAELRTGIAAHAFDHLGAIGDQAETAAASGATIIYATGLGVAGYAGLPQPDAMSQQCRATQAYIQNARRHGIRLAIGYVCATSIVDLDTFDRHWSPEFRARFHAPVAAWRQQDRRGNPLPSWYGGQYHPACMNNPDWREYERFMVCEQLAAGCDGIFFDNPTMHPQGCYCPWCMQRFAQFLKDAGRLSPADASSRSGTNATAALRKWADKHPADFLEFRGTIARDFLAEMRVAARAVRRGALVTANNSLNSPGVFYSQCRNYGYNIYEMSRAEDFVVVEDMASQPRILANGQTVEYGPVYQELRAICHGKPLVAVTIADGDYHTAPDLVRLAAAEAAANDASYLSWPTWPEPERARMAAVIRPEIDLLRRHASLFLNARPRRDVLLFLPFRQWLATDQCQVWPLAAALTRANVAYEVICEDALPEQLPLRGARLLLVESAAVFTAGERGALKKFRDAGGSVLTAEKADWLASVQAAIGSPSITVRGPATVRAIIRDQRQRTIVHLFNLNVQRFDSFNDRVSDVADLRVSVRVPLKKVRSARALTADAGATSGVLKFSTAAEGVESRVEITIPRLSISTMVVIE